MLMTPLLRPCYCVVSQWCAHFSFVFLLLRSCFHKDGWTYLTSSWCTSRLNFPSYNMPPVLRTYTHNYSYTPNYYFIWTHATHDLKTTNPKIELTPCMANVMDNDCCDFGIVYVSFNIRKQVHVMF
jgi:hypothetical protein